MDLFSVDFTPNELSFIRQALDVVSVSGKDAKFLANLQVKIEGEIEQIIQMKAQAEIEKTVQLKEIIHQEEKKTSSAKK
jgi:hypothetical protein